MGQGDLFGMGDSIPKGLSYKTDLLDRAYETALIDALAALPLAPFEFHGWVGKRRVLSFGWKYDYDKEVAEPAPAIPSFLHAIRDKAAAFAGLEARALEQASVIEYREGAAIGWHRDKATFGTVVGISLGSSCRFMMRRKAGTKWERYEFLAEPRSAYVLRGPARTEWEHSIPGVEALRYSITFRERARTPARRPSS
jgi:alkylated DNA repair dioxygenase AlkB